MATEVPAPPGEVWRRLADPDAMARWHPGSTGPVAAKQDWPEPGATLRLRTRLHRLPLELSETVLEAVPGRRLRCDVRLGLHRFEACFTLAAERGGRHTRLGLRVVTGSRVPLVGGALDRFATRRLAAEMAAMWLAALREGQEEPEAAGPDPTGPEPRVDDLSPARSPRGAAAPPRRPPPSRPGA